MGYSGEKKFTIYNDRNEDILQFRLTHFMNGEDNEVKNKVVTKDVFKNNESFAEIFESVSGRDDQWFIQFNTLEKGCKMTKSLTANMGKEKDDFKIRIEFDSLVITWSEKGKTSSKKIDIKRVSKIMD